MQLGNLLDSIATEYQGAERGTFEASKKKISTLAGVVQWNERWPVNQRVTSSIPSQGTCLGCRPSI